MLLGQMYRFGLGTQADPIESYALVRKWLSLGEFGFRKNRSANAAFASMPPADREKAPRDRRQFLAEIQQPSPPSKKL